MKKITIIKLTIFVITSATMLVSCGDPVDITKNYDLTKDAGKVPPYLIEGLVINGAGPHYVKISKPASISSSSEEIVGNATVTISDNRGNEESLAFSPADGKFWTSSLVGMNDGRVYILNVNINGQKFMATSVMPPSLYPVDKITFGKDTEDKKDTSWYKAKLYTRVHTEFDEYYLLKFYRDDALVNEPDDIYYADNSQLNGFINGFEVPGRFKKGQKFKMYFYSITREAYNLYDDINSQLGNDGGVTSGPPANVKGNIEGASGLFQAAYLVTDSIKIE